MVDSKRTGKRPDDLIVDSEAPQGGGEQFDDQLQRTLRETEIAVRGLTEFEASDDQAASWERARDIVQEFRPVPFFIWRLCNFVLGRPGQVGELAEGSVFGLRRLMFAAASDPVLGAGEKINNMRKAFTIVPSDVVAAVSVIHAVCRRLGNRPHERIWRPLLDDALLRARIGYEIGRPLAEFGPGRAMLAGFAGRCGLSILISSGDLDEARTALELLATGAEIREVGNVIYHCDPLQVSAMWLTACGCGRDAAFGTVAYASKNPGEVVEGPEQLRWLAAFAICENMRRGTPEQVDEEHWAALNVDPAAREWIGTQAKQAIRRGHGWGWIV